MPQKQLDLFSNKVEETFVETIKEHENIFKALTDIENKDSIDQIVIDLHNIAHRVENNGNPDGIGYSIRAVADRLSECKKPGFHMEWVPDSESWYEP
jgi:hypothetical protein